MNIVDAIREKYPFLTRKQREIVDYILEDPDRMSYVTLKEMSRDVHVTEATILKTCGVLGYPSFTSLKYEFRKYSARQMELFRHEENKYSAFPPPSGELDDPERLLTEVCREESNLLKSFFHELDLSALFAAADWAVGADRVILCGRGVSKQVCDFLAMRLAVVGLGSVEIDSELDDSIHAALPLMGPGSLLIAVSFPDYYRMTTKVAEYASRKGCRVLGVTDSAKSPIAPFCGRVLLTPTKTRMFLNTISAAMALGNLLSTAITIRLGGSGEIAPTVTEFYEL